MEIRSPYSACTALLERLPRFSAAARSMAAMGGARTSSSANYRHRIPRAVPAVSKAGILAVRR